MNFRKGATKNLNSIMNDTTTRLSHESQALALPAKLRAKWASTEAHSKERELQNAR